MSQRSGRSLFHASTWRSVSPDAHHAETFPRGHEREPEEPDREREGAHPYELFNPHEPARRPSPGLLAPLDAAHRLHSRSSSVGSSRSLLKKVHPRGLTKDQEDKAQKLYALTQEVKKLRAKADEMEAKRAAMESRYGPEIQGEVAQLAADNWKEGDEE